MDINTGIKVLPFEITHGQDVIDLIVGIQQKEFNLPIEAADQPDLMNIPDFYQKGAGNFWIATCDNHVVGTLALLDLGNNMAALRKMFVHSLFRGEKSGTAKKLLTILMVWAQTHGIKEIFLGTTPKFLAAHRFYEKYGFKEIKKTNLPPCFPIMKVDTRFYTLEI